MTSFVYIIPCPFTLLHLLPTLLHDDVIGVKNVNGTDIRRSEKVFGVFGTSYVDSVYVLCSAGLVFWLVIFMETE